MGTSSNHNAQATAYSGRYAGNMQSMDTSLTPGRLLEALTALGAVLTEAGERHEFVVVGGASLSLRGLIARSTADVDVLGHIADGTIESVVPLPPTVLAAADAVADAYGLQRGWFGDDRTAGLLTSSRPLPRGMASRVERVTFGSGLVLDLASRVDIICLKLDAAFTLGDDTMRTKHHRDLEELAPTDDELSAAAAWVEVGIAPSQTHDDELAALLTWIRSRRS
ncbi:MAG: hypothetical protein JWM90_2999 [Thermoleophilia bacterium]|nr:hypothetical protein [Thermoleophilia bacterium]